jgi:hypothetical protein
MEVKKWGEVQEKISHLPTTLPQGEFPANTAVSLQETRMISSSTFGENLTTGAASPAREDSQHSKTFPDTLSADDATSPMVKMYS